jgi:uncharacterized membrane protein
MNFKKKIESCLQINIYAIEILVYSITFLILLNSVIRATYIYYKRYNEGSIASVEARILLGETVALALSFILVVEILKIYYIKTYKQFILVGSIVLLKLIINYFLSKETKSEYDKRKLFNSLK